MSETVRALTEALIRRPSITPDDDGCQRLLVERLEPLGFACETIAGGGVTNLWAIRRATRTGPTLVFAGHTDVVPPGPPDQWRSDPFVPTEREGKLYGRGAADMKSAIAAFVVAVEEYLASTSEPRGNLAFLITSDEEGAATDGTVKVVEWLARRGDTIDYCLVGEPTSVKVLGDTIKNGRRGSLSGRLVVKGLQGHVAASPHLVRNPVHLSAPAIANLVSETWDDGDEYFPPTTFQISNYRAGTGAENVVPGEAVIDFNFRFSAASPAERLKERLTSILLRHGLDFSIAWNLVGQPFVTPRGALSDALALAIAAETGVAAELSTAGGTSDGRFIAEICPQVCEFGPLSASIHSIDEHVDVDGLDVLKNIYRRVIETLLEG
jgi:succinyl-diaminopimelate desuccinylase